MEKERERKKWNHGEHEQNGGAFSETLGEKDPDACHEIDRDEKARPGKALEKEPAQSPPDRPGQVQA